MEARVGKEKAQAKSNRAAGEALAIINSLITSTMVDMGKYKDMPLPWTMFHSSREILDRINRVYLQEAALYSDVLQIAGQWTVLSMMGNLPSLIQDRSGTEEGAISLRLFCTRMWLRMYATGSIWIVC